MKVGHDGPHDRNLTDPIEVRVGDEFDISMTALGAAGYAWTPDMTGEAAGRLDYQGDTWEGSPGGPLGASRRQQLHFRAIAPGQVTIRVSYGRTWEAASEATRDFRVIIRE